MEGDVGRRQLDHGADATGNGVGNVVQLEIEEEAHAGRPHRLRKRITDAGRTVRQEEFQPQLDAAYGGFRPSGDRVDELACPDEVGGVDAAVDGIGAGHAHIGRP